MYKNPFIYLLLAGNTDTESTILLFNSVNKMGCDVAQIGPRWERVVEKERQNMTRCAVNQCVMRGIMDYERD